MSDDGVNREWWRVAVVWYDLEGVSEFALDAIWPLIAAAKSEAGDEFAAFRAEREGGTAEDTRADLHRHADHALRIAREELRKLAREVFEELINEAFSRTGELLAAVAMDRMPEFFDAELRRESRQYPVNRTSEMLDGLVSVGRPKSKMPLLPEEAALFVQHVEIGRDLFAGVRRNSESLAAAQQAIHARLSDRRQLAAAERVVKAVHDGEIKGKDIQPKKLALRFAANFAGIPPATSTRTLLRWYDMAVEVANGG